MDIVMNMRVKRNSAVDVPSQTNKPVGWAALYDPVTPLSNMTPFVPSSGGPSIVLSESVAQQFITSTGYWSFKTVQNLVEYFLASYDTRWQQTNVRLNIYGLNDVNIKRSGDNELNVLISEENCCVRSYPHHTKFGNYGDPNVQIYVYSHIDKLVMTDNYIAIPGIWLRMKHFTYFKDRDVPFKPKNFRDKRYALLTTPNQHNADCKMRLFRGLQNLSDVDVINKDCDVRDMSIRSNRDFISFLGGYKFLIICENSQASGYVTEKLFNAFHAGTIPVYWGAEASKFIRHGSYIDATDMSEAAITAVIASMLADENKYEKMVMSNKLLDFPDFMHDLFTFIISKTRMLD